MDITTAELEVICKHCGQDLGSHHAGSTTYPWNYCPGPLPMDWENGPGTTFEPEDTEDAKVL